MMNPQEFYIQHLGIGSIWKLRSSNEAALLAIAPNSAEPIKFNKNALEFGDVSFNILMLRSDDPTSNEAEQLCENVMQAMRYGSQVDVTLKKTVFSDQHHLFEQLIQLSGVRVIAFFEDSVLEKMRKFLESHQNSLIESIHTEAFIWNDLLFIQFPTLAEMIAHPSLKKHAWEKTCLLQKHLHSA